MSSPSPDDRAATTLVIEMKPGWIYFKIAEPKPEPDMIEWFLRLTIRQWLHQHPQFVIDKTEAVTERGILQGINVWYRLNEQQMGPVSPEPPQQPSSLAFAVDHQVFQQLPREHIEALINEALEVCRPQQDWQGSLVVINPGRIAVVLDKQAKRGAVLPVEMVYPGLEDATVSRVRTWLEAPPNRRHVVLFNGSWFAPGKKETGSPPAEMREPDSRHTNMTYDTWRCPPDWDGGGGSGYRG